MGVMKGVELSARVAQLVEQLICNQLVGGSSPFSGSQRRRSLFESIGSAAGGVGFRVANIAAEAGEAEGPPLF